MLVAGTSEQTRENRLATI